MKYLIHLWKALGYSFQGLQDTTKYEVSFRMELVLAFILVPTAIFLSVSVMSKVMLVSSVFLVLIVELVNSGIEASVNRISSEQHYLSKRAKYAGSAAVFLSVVNLFIVWFLILFDLISKNL